MGGLGDGWLLGTLIREGFNYLLKAGSSALPTVAFFVVVYFLREGLQVVRGYVGSKDQANSELLSFIRETQKRQDGREDRFAQTFDTLSQTLTRLNSEVEGQGRKQDAMALRIDEVHKDILRRPNAA